jgi:hypothetical protein
MYLIVGELILVALFLEVSLDLHGEDPIVADRHGDCTDNPGDRYDGVSRT